MTCATMLGFAGDFLTFLGGFILSLDALFREREFRKQKDWGRYYSGLQERETNQAWCPVAEREIG